jgi:hypothetical protein
MQNNKLVKNTLATFLSNISWMGPLDGVLMGIEWTLWNSLQYIILVYYTSDMQGCLCHRAHLNVIREGWSIAGSSFTALEASVKQITPWNVDFTKWNQALTCTTLGWCFQPWYNKKVYLIQLCDTLEKANSRDNKRQRKVGMSRWSTWDFLGREAVLCDTVMAGICHYIFCTTYNRHCTESALI